MRSVRSDETAGGARLGKAGFRPQCNVTTSADDHRTVPVGSVQGEAEAAKMLGDAVKNNPGETSYPRTAFSMVCACHAAYCSCTTCRVLQSAVIACVCSSEYSA